MTVKELIKQLSVFPQDMVCSVFGLEYEDEIVWQELECISSDDGFLRLHGKEGTNCENKNIYDLYKLFDVVNEYFNNLTDCNCACVETSFDVICLSVPKHRIHLSSFEEFDKELKNFILKYDLLKQNFEIQAKEEPYDYIATFKKA